MFFEEYEPIPVSKEQVKREEIKDWVDKNRDEWFLYILPCISITPLDFDKLEEEFERMEKAYLNEKNVEPNVWSGKRKTFSEKQRLSCFFIEKGEAFFISQIGALGTGLHIRKILPVEKLTIDDPQKGEESYEGVPVPPFGNIKYYDYGGCIELRPVYLKGVNYVCSCVVSEIPAWTRPIFNKVPLRV